MHRAVGRTAGLKSFCIILLLFFSVPERAQSETRVKFPSEQPDNGNFNRPSPGEVLDISPPGFCWWRAGERGKVSYRLRIAGQDAKAVYTSPMLNDPVHVPTKTLAPGRYTWSVEALGSGGEVLDTRSPSAFSIAENPIPMPWVAPKELLARVPRERPRLLFPKDQLQEIRATLNTTRKNAFETLRAAADEALTFPLMKRPDFDKFDRKTQYSERRVSYRASYQEFSDVFHKGMTPMALMYALTGETKYGVAAKAHLLNLLHWDPDGIASLESSFDEIGLRIDRTAAQAYDWLYDLFSEQERDAVKQMLITHGNNMLHRLQERDFLNCSAYSHDGRLPGYLIEFSIALAEEPVAEEWMDYAMKALLTVFPHWAGKDGGWAEGINYALSYNDRFITPLQSLHASTGYDLWQKPFFRKFRYFLVYNVAPGGEILPFGDGEHKGIDERGDELFSVLQFHASLYGDATVRRWMNLLDRSGFEPDRLGVMHRLILPDTLSAGSPINLPQDRAFRGIGWAALHTNLLEPENDLMVMFKSSPFGAVSHSHADQNSFAIMKGGKALAIPGGERYPQHGSPFHEEYAQQSLAHNVLLINGKGQINRDGKAKGGLCAFKTMPHIGYVAGEAHAAYGKPVTRHLRHIVLLRPSLVLIVDEVEASEYVQVEWLMHAKEKLDLNEADQAFTSSRKDAFMKVHFFSSGGLEFRQDNAWPVDPRKDYPMVMAEPPAKQWHFSAKCREKSKAIRIAAVMAVGEDGDQPEIEVKRNGTGKADIIAHFKGIGRARVTVNLSADGPMLDIRYEPLDGEAEFLSVLRKMVD